MPDGDVLSTPVLVLVGWYNNVNWYVCCIVCSHHYVLPGALYAEAKKKLQKGV